MLRIRLDFASSSSCPHSRLVISQKLVYNWRDWEGIPINRFKDTLVPMALVMRLGAIVVTAILVTLVLGLWIDKRFGIAPCGLLLFMLIGVVLSIIGVYRTVQDVYDKYAPPKEGK